MNFSMQLAVAIAAVACLCVVAGAPDGRLARTKQQRPTRGFKNVEMMTARGFGKRDRPHTRAEQQDAYEPHPRRKFNPKNSLMVAYDFGKRSGNDETTDEVYMDNFWDLLDAASEREGQDFEEKNVDSIPMDWFVSEMLNNPEFARSLVRKFIDLNQDGRLSSDELLRNVV